MTSIDGCSNLVSRKCSACKRFLQKCFSHPLLSIPICQVCHTNYNSGEFTLDPDGQNEIFCRWCGEGEDELLLCDTCPKSFCARCLRNNFGSQEVQRIRNIPQRWSCIVCSPQPLIDLCKRNGWASIIEGSNLIGNESFRIRNTSSGKMIYRDISKGREQFEIPVYNDVDKEPPPLDFVYINRPVAGKGVRITTNPNFLSCCDCTDNCVDSSKCQCAINSRGAAYDIDGKLLADKPTGIYECNYRCKCHVNKCKNRVVSRGPKLRLEVFRCSDPSKGWGVRCRDKIAPGTYVADYIGEILPESAAEERGLSKSDEYIFNMDCWGRSVADLRLDQLALKVPVESIPRESLVDVSILTKDMLKGCIDDELIELLAAKGAIGRKKRKRPAQVENDTTSEANKVGRPKKQSSQTQEVNDDKSWLDNFIDSKKESWNQAISVITDRSILEVEEKGEEFVIDCRYA